MRILDFIMNNENYLQDFITRSTYHSNGIEGSTLSYAETYALLFNDNSFNISGKEPREIYETINHKKALILLFRKLMDDNVLDERYIKTTNEIINKDINDTIGYRDVQVMIRGSEYIPPKPENINNLMMYFVYNYNNSCDEIYFRVAKYHIEFERIHPFIDGNGRTGRLLINYELLKNNYAPIVILKEDRIKYFEYLRKEDIEGLANWFKELSEKETKRLIEFGYKI